MDAIIKGKDLRFSQLLSRVAYKIYPETKKIYGYVTYKPIKIYRINLEMANELDKWSIKNETGNVVLRKIQWQISNSWKLYTLLEWYLNCEGESLTFA